MNKIEGKKTVPIIGHFILPNIISIHPNSHYKILGLSESQDTILLHVLFSDYYLIQLVFDKPIFLKH